MLQIVAIPSPPALLSGMVGKNDFHTVPQIQLLICYLQNCEFAIWDNSLQYGVYQYDSKIYVVNLI